MKKLFQVGTCVLCIASSSITNAQNLNGTKNQPIMDSTIGSTLLVCKLSGPEFQKRKAALQNEIFSLVTSFKELDSGYIFHFEDKDDFAEKLVDYMLAEKKCCPFFQMDLSIRPDQGGISLKLTGPPEAKDLMEDLVKQ